MNRPQLVRLFWMASVRKFVLRTHRQASLRPTSQSTRRIPSPLSTGMSRAGTRLCRGSVGLPRYLLNWSPILSSVSTASRTFFMEAAMELRSARGAGSLFLPSPSPAVVGGLSNRAVRWMRSRRTSFTFCADRRGMCS